MVQCDNFKLKRFIFNEMKIRVRIDELETKYAESIQRITLKNKNDCANKE